MKTLLISFVFLMVFHTPLRAQLPFNNHEHLNINDVDAGISVAGLMHFDSISGPDYEVPKGSGLHTVLASSLWMGGLDPGGQLHGSVQTYGQSGAAFWPGPIGSISIPFDSVSCSLFDRIWKIDRWKVEEFIYQFSIGNVINGIYPVPQEIATWPAKGNGIVNDHLAPFTDFNGDGNYNVMDGDYPDILGDQMLYFIFNDALGIQPSGSIGFGIEVQVKAYAYNCPNIPDSNIVLNRTTLYQFTIINRSSVNYDNVLTGFWSDLDLGNSWDNYFGCDSTRASAFAYHGSAYGPNPPMQNIKILRGSLADPNDLLDNDLDGTIDEPGERTTMNSFISYINANNNPAGNPVTFLDYYSYMQSFWLDGMPLTYGADGRDPSSFPTNFMYSGVPYDPSGWSQITAGSVPEDRNVLLTSGPVTMEPGDTLTFDIAYVFTWDSLSPNGLTTSIARNQADLDRVQYWFDTNTFPSCEVYSVSLPENPLPENISLYPNPSQQSVMVLSNGKALIDYDYTIFNLQGAEVAKGRLHIGGIDISSLSPQPYFLRIEIPSGPVTQKMIKM